MARMERAHHTFILSVHGRLSQTMLDKGWLLLLLQNTSVLLGM